ncbi:transporter substrate-binding domain-containing protein [Kitasatospora sp. NPDC051705]|uniref:transporter substrate-binding domain-containing protein n=1 Tax=Kitasatospora sp. NPDC051705 TaxID=3364057 RepID=UPI0037AA2AB4
MKFPYRGRAVAFFSVTSIMAASACAGDNGPKPPIFKQDRLVVGVKNDQPGTSVVDHYGHSGFDIQVVYHLAKAEGVEPKKIAFNDISSDDRERALKDNRVDLVVATFSINDERLAGINFAGPYLVTMQGFLRRKGDVPLKSSDDLNGKPVCAWTGTTSEDVLSKQYPQIHQISGKDAQDCINKLKSGEVAAVSTDQLILYGFAHVDPSVEVSTVTIGSPNNYGVGISKDHPEDCKELAAKIVDYVTSSDWQNDLMTAFPELKDGDHWKDFQPKPQQIGCHDKPSAVVPAR